MRKDGKLLDTCILWDLKMLLKPDSARKRGQQDKPLTFRNHLIASQDESREVRAKTAETTQRQCTVATNELLSRRVLKSWRYNDGDDYTKPQPRLKPRFNNFN